MYVSMLQLKIIDVVPSSFSVVPMDGDKVFLHYSGKEKAMEVFNVAVDFFR